MPIVSSYTVARRRQPNHLGCVRPMGRLGRFDTTVLSLLPRMLAAVRFRARARGVFIFVRNFSREIFLRESRSKVAEAAALQLLLL
jgi:hypothetical protein